MSTHVLNDAALISSVMHRKIKYVWNLFWELKSSMYFRTLILCDLFHTFFKVLACHVVSWPTFSNKNSLYGSRDPKHDTYSAHLTLI